MARVLESSKRARAGRGRRARQGRPSSALASTRLGRRARHVVLRSGARVAERWDRWLLHVRPPVVELEHVRRRLELLLAAYYGRAISIEASDAAREAGWFGRYVLRSRARRSERDTFPHTDGERIFLPRALDASRGEDAAVALYRLLAIEQAERIVRGSAAGHPGADAHPLVRELYLLSEGAAIDAAIARRVGGIRPVLAAARAASLARRPRLPYLMPARNEVERLVRASLAAPPETIADGMVDADSPAASLAWARATAERMGTRQRYERVRPVAHWGTASPPPEWDPAYDMPSTDAVLRSLVPREPPMPLLGIEAYGGSGEGDGARLTANADGAVTYDQQPRGSPAGGAPASGGGGGTGESAITSNEPPAPAADRATHPLGDSASAVGTTRVPSRAPTAPGQQYAEWDYVTSSYRERAVTVHGGRVAEGTAHWARSLMSEHAALVRGIRQRFERLRARRVRLRQQLDGEELDLAACVSALVDRRMGRAGDERLYVASRATRQPLAIALLVDVSGSTSSPVGGGRRMIDVEKVALLLASEALSALGDRYAILTFTGHGAKDVRVDMVKEFAEANTDTVRRRIAGLRPGGFTRLGAAIRHATAVLVREPVRHRLLLILSDGRPNDLGYYMADYGVEDSRQAINEARARGIHPFCLNVDPEGPEYLARIFGPVGYVTLGHPDQLPRALLQAVRTLIE